MSEVTPWSTSRFVGTPDRSALDVKAVSSSTLGSIAVCFRASRRDLWWSSSGYGVSCGRRLAQHPAPIVKLGGSRQGPEAGPARTTAMVRLRRLHLRSVEPAWEYVLGPCSCGRRSKAPMCTLGGDVCGRRIQRTTIRRRRRQGLSTEAGLLRW